MITVQYIARTGSEMAQPEPAYNATTSVGNPSGMQARIFGMNQAKACPCNECPFRENCIGICNRFDRYIKTGKA